MPERNENVLPRKRILAGVYKTTETEAADGNPVAINVDSTGRIKLSYTALHPTAGGGQTVAFGAVSDRTTALTVGSPYHIWSTKICWIRIGDSSVTAQANDFPLAPGAVYEYTATDDDDKYIAVIQYDQVGTLFVGRAA